MKFTLALTINKNRQTVWKAFDNPKNMKRWMPTLESFEPCEHATDPKINRLESTGPNLMQKPRRFSDSQARRPWP